VRRELAAVLEAHDRADPRGSSATTSRAVSTSAPNFAAWRRPGR
jgi:hypothetical protein